MSKKKKNDDRREDSRVTSGDKRVDRLLSKGLDTTFAYNIKEAEDATGGKARITSGYRDTKVDQIEWDKAFNKHVKGKFSKKIEDEIRKGNSINPKTGKRDGRGVVNKRLLKLGAGKDAIAALKAFRANKAAVGTSKHTVTRTTADIARTGSSKKVKEWLEKNKGYKEHLERDSKGRVRKDIYHIEKRKGYKAPLSTMGEIRLKDEGRFGKKKLTLADKLKELGKIDPKGSNTKENIEAVLENDPTKLVPQISEDTPRLAMLNLDEKLRRERPEEEIVREGARAKADLIAQEQQIAQKQAGEEAFQRAPSQVKELAKSQIDDPKLRNEVVRDMSNKEKGKPRKEGPASQFTEALTFFLPQIIGGLAGAAFEGGEGAIAGMEQGGQMGAAFRQHQMDKEKLEIEKGKEKRLSEGKYQLSTMQDDAGESQVYRVNLSTGEKEQLGKKGYAKGYVKDPNTGFLINKQTGDTLKQTGDTLNLGGDVTNKTFFSALTPVQRTQFLDSRKSFLTESKPMREAAYKVEGLINKRIDLAITNPAAKSQLGADVASLYENGRLTDEDVLRYTRRSGIPDRISDTLKDLKAGTITPDKAEDIKESLIVLREVLIDQVNKISEERSGQYASDWGLPKEDVTNAFWKKMEQPKSKKAMSKEAYLKAIDEATSEEEIEQIDLRVRRLCLKRLT
jgi:hypothetical protein